MQPLIQHNFSKDFDSYLKGSVIFLAKVAIGNIFGQKSTRNAKN